VTTAWNLWGFSILEALPKRRAFDAEYYRGSILTALVFLRPEGAGRKLVIHADNAKAHTAQKSIAFCAESGLELA
jgi:hypothetical protein